MSHRKFTVNALSLYALLASLSTAAFAADRNAYTAQYERAIPTEPSCSVVIRSTDDPNWSRLNDSGTRVICLEPGDYTGRGVIDLTASGTPGNERWLRYSASGDTGAHPFKQTSSQRATIAGLRFRGANYWIVRRVSINGGGGGNIGLEFSESANSDNNIVDSVLAENAHATMAAVFYSNDFNTIQNSVLRNCLATPDQDWPAIGFFGGPIGTRIVNNETYNCTKGFYISEHVAAGTIVENNDMYVSPEQYTDCNGHYNGTGPCAAAEIVVGLKAGGSADNPVSIVHNRFWGARSTDLSNICCGSGAQGDVVHFSNALNNPSAGARYVLLKNNIVMDGQSGIGDYWDFTRNNSIIGNIVYNIKQHYAANPSHALSATFMSNTQYYLNTLIDTNTWFEFGGGQNNDVRCNVMINSGPQTGSAASGTQVDSNVFYNSRSYTTGSSNIVITDANAANSNDYCFYRKLQTGAEQVCIPRARPTSASPHYKACDPNIGSRPGIGAGGSLF
jgi:hypothetical protein